MTDEHETKTGRTREVESLRRRIAELEAVLAHRHVPGPARDAGAPDAREPAAGTGESDRIHELVQESDIRLHTVVESLPFDFFLIGPDGRYVMQNSSSRRNWGDAVGKRPEDFCPDERTWAIWEANNRRAFAGEVVEREVAFGSPSGTRYCYNIISPIRHGDEIRGILGVNIDITARKLAEQALQRLNDELEDRIKERTARLEAEMEHRKLVETKLRESEAQYRTLVESTGEHIAQVDGDGRFLFLNGAAARLLGGKPEDFVGRRAWDSLPPGAAERQIHNIQTVIRTRRSVTVEVPVLLHGRTAWFSMAFEPMMDSSGNVGSVLVVARDIQELQEARKELQAYQDRMARAERLASLGTLSAMVAHEMNQPLTVIRLTLQDCLAQLKSGGLSRDTVTDLESCLEEVSTAAGLRRSTSAGSLSRSSRPRAASRRQGWACASSSVSWPR